MQTFRQTVSAQHYQVLCTTVEFGPFKPKSVATTLISLIVVALLSQQGCKRIVAADWEHPGHGSMYSRLSFSIDGFPQGGASRDVKSAFVVFQFAVQHFFRPQYYAWALLLKTFASDGDAHQAAWKPLALLTASWKPLEQQLANAFA